MRRTVRFLRVINMSLVVSCTVYINIWMDIELYFTLTYSGSIQYLNILEQSM